MRLVLRWSPRPDNALLVGQVDMVVLQLTTQQHTFTRRSHPPNVMCLLILNCKQDDRKCNHNYSTYRQQHSRKLEIMTYVIFRIFPIYECFIVVGWKQSQFITMRKICCWTFISRSEWISFLFDVSESFTVGGFLSFKHYRSPQREHYMDVMEQSTD